jgi:prephenate dehydrogenase
MSLRIAILGTGLIGGSLGLAWKERRTDCTIVGHDRPDVLDRAAERNAIDAKAADPITAVDDADLVVLATPLSATLRLLEQIADHLEPDTLVTDVASVKGPVMEQAQEVLPPDTPFIGGHPMAGSEGQGIDHASPILFENAAYVLCRPDSEADPSQRANEHPAFMDLIAAIGARPMLMDARRHDRIAGAVSHLPQLLAVALVNTAGDVNEDDPQALQLAAGGFRDMTRIASSPFSMWRDILIGNQGAVLDMLGHFTRRLQSMRNRLIEEDLEGLEDAFESAYATRRDVPTDSKGFLHPLADVYVAANDRPGVLADMTTALTEADLNIKDIELLKFREGTGGTFRLGFDSDADAADAIDVLDTAGFRAHRP